MKGKKIKKLEGLIGVFFGRQIQWAIQLRSCLLCMTSLNKISFNRIYCGLSDGNLAIVEVTNKLKIHFNYSIISYSYIINTNPKKHFV